MGFELGHLFFAGVMYLLALFLIAWATEQGWVPRRVARHPVTYALSLGVYATTWSFYGSVGFAERAGYSFLAIYLGVTLAFVLTPILLLPILRLVRDYQLSSLADLLAFRFQSQAAGVCVTLFMLAGMIPYLALQIQAVSQSIRILTSEAPPNVVALGFCIIVILFAILFGARHLSPRDKHEGLVVAIAFESLVKLAALVGVGLFAVFGVFGGTDGLGQWLEEHPEAVARLYAPVREAPWTTLLLLSFSAAFLLPRQFHMAFAENMDENALRQASWRFPLYLLALNLAIPPIVWAGMATTPEANPDYWVLAITVQGEDRALAAIAFIGGISAASAMMIVSTLALAAMSLNHLLLPASYRDPDIDLYRRLLWGRRTLIALIVMTGYAFYRALEHGQGLVELGLLSFVAAIQFLPGVLATLYWPRATRSGFLAGLGAGAGVWGITLLAPRLAPESTPGMLGQALLDFGAGAGFDGWSMTTFLSLGLNLLLLALVSLLTRPDERELRAIEACTEAPLLPLPTMLVQDARSSEDFKARLARILGPSAARHEVEQAMTDLGMSGEETNPNELGRLRERIERNLSGLMGPVLARVIVDERLRTGQAPSPALAHTMRQIEERLEASEIRFQGIAAELDRLRRYHRRILQELPLAACAVDSAGTVVTWNRAMTALTGISPRRARGSRVGELPPPWGALLEDASAGPPGARRDVRLEVDGATRRFNLHKADLVDPPESAMGGGTVILLEDLSELHRLESQLAHSERLASIGRLAAGIAHEIGNPVTGIACLAQNLVDESGDPEVVEAAETMLHEVRRITHIVSALLDFSHSGSHEGGATDLVPVSMNECVDEALALLEMDRARDGPPIERHEEEELRVRGSRPALVQVLVNLLSNARDAVRERYGTGGAAGGEGRAPSLPPIGIHLARRDGEVVLEVRDQGCGIPPGLLQHAVEPFVTTKPPGRGTGLGLSIAYSILREHGGRLGLESAPGAGTTARVILPLAPAGEGEVGDSGENLRAWVP